MKFTWGHGLTLALIAFIGYILYFVIWSFDIDFQMEAEDYYGKELKFQEQIDKSNNHESLSTKLEIERIEAQIVFNFPHPVDSGTIIFFRPSEESKDVTIEINPNESGVQSVDISEFTKGRYIIRTDWVANGKGFFLEKNIVI